MGQNCPLCGSPVKALSVRIPVFRGKASGINHYKRLLVCLSPSCVWYSLVRFISNSSIIKSSGESKKGGDASEL